MAPLKISENIIFYMNTIFMGANLPKIAISGKSCWFSILSNSPRNLLDDLLEG